MKKKIIAIAAAICVALPLISVSVPAAEDDGMNMYSKSEFIEKEQPELSEETKKAISLYQRQPTEEHYLALREVVIKDYNAVLERKEKKLAELKDETAGKPGGEDIVAEMEEIVQEMYVTYWNRINSSMLRFTDTRLLKWKTSEASKYEYIPVMGAGESVYVKRTPVTNAEYAEFIRATGHGAPSNWINGTYSDGEDDFPVNCVSYGDANAYCEWLTQKDGVNTYRLPNESEWELAAGHMPKDADFNCRVTDGRTSVLQYADVTRGAHGAVDFWGNVWEWTSTVRDSSDGTTQLAVKGGSWSSPRTDCRTEYRKEKRDAAVGHEDVGFRVLQILNGSEPEQKVELATLASPTVSAVSTAPGSETLSWQSVDGANEYQLFEYFEETGLLYMRERTSQTSITLDGLAADTTYRYIVQPISYTSIADNVSGENSIAFTCTESFTVHDYNGMGYLLYTPANTGENMPLIVYLHGMNGKGDDPTMLLDMEFPKILSGGTLGDIPAYILMPQLPEGDGDWITQRKKVVELIKATVSDYDIDGENVSLTGFSMGGAGVWNVAAAYPEMFCRIAPLSGGARSDEKILTVLSDTPVWAFIGTADTVVKPQNTIEFMEKLSRTNSQTKLTQFEGAAHTDVPALAYGDTDLGLINWLIGK